MEKIEHELRDDWEYLMNDLIKSYLDFSITDEIDFYEDTQSNFTLDNKDINVFIVVDVNKSYELKFFNEFLDIVYGILKSCKTFNNMVGNLIVSENGSLDIYDLFSYPTLENLNNEFPLEFKDILSWIDAHYVYINLIVYYTGKKIDLKGMKYRFPIVWALTDDVKMSYGRSVIIFNSKEYDSENIRNHMQQ